MKVPFMDLNKQYQSLKNIIDEEIAKVFETSAFASGPFVEKFETYFANYIQTKHSVGVNSGTSALHLALLALGVKPGDEVITTPHTFVSTVWAISYVGAKPVFVDIEPDTYTIDPNKITEKIKDKTKAIIPVHLYGHPAGMDRIMEIAKQHNLYVIEDAAQAHGAEFHGNKCGSIGDIGCFSFYPGKNLGAFGEAGAVTTNSEETAKKIREYRNHCQPEKYIHYDIGFNYRMDGIQGAVLGVKLKMLDLWNTKRKNIADKYTQSLSFIEELKCPTEAEDINHVYHQYELQLKDIKTRDRLAEYLNNHQIATGLHYPVPVHLQEAYKSLGYKKGDFPETEKAADCNLSLPIYPEMTSNMTDYVIQNIRDFF
jgi:dTDP-4-amino-4,6-dideoxygalactose transaminase